MKALLAAACLSLIAGTAFAQSRTYDVVTIAPANAGQVVEAGGTRTYYDDRGWYGWTLGPEDETGVDDSGRYFNLNSVDYRFAAIGVQESDAGDRTGDQSFETIQALAETLIFTDNDPDFVNGLEVSERRVLTLPAAPGKDPVEMIEWISPQSDDHGDFFHILVALYHTKGIVIFHIFAEDVDSAERAIKDHLHIAEAVVK